MLDYERIVSFLGAPGGIQATHILSQVVPKVVFKQNTSGGTQGGIQAKHIRWYPRWYSSKTHQMVPKVVFKQNTFCPRWHPNDGLSILTVPRCVSVCMDLTTGPQRAPLEAPPPCSLPHSLQF